VVLAVTTNVGQLLEGTVQYGSQDSEREGGNALPSDCCEFNLGEVLKVDRDRSYARAGGGREGGLLLVFAVAK
jgi:hypothetical protein